MVTTVCSKVTRDFDTLGAHTLRWRYLRDSSGSGGDNAGWVDCVEWTPASSSSSDDWDEIEYAYDASGRRVAKDVDGVLTKYLYDGDQCIAEYDANDTLLCKYIYGPGIDQPICMIEVQDANAAYYYHYDALGSVVALSDADGDTVQVYEYDIFGQVAASDANHPNPFTFTGRRYDAETGLYYYRARHYNPTIGRFLQTDPIGYDGGMNLYRYCNNNPWNLVDPYGRDCTGSNDPCGSRTLDDIGFGEDDDGDGSCGEGHNLETCLDKVGDRAGLLDIVAGAICGTMGGAIGGAVTGGGAGAISGAIDGFVSQMSMLEIDSGTLRQVTISVVSKSKAQVKRPGLWSRLRSAAWGAFVGASVTGLLGTDPSVRCSYNLYK